MSDEPAGFEVERMAALTWCWSSQSVFCERLHTYKHCTHFFSQWGRERSHDSTWIKRNQRGGFHHFYPGEDCISLLTFYLLHLCHLANLHLFEKKPRGSEWNLDIVFKIIEQIIGWTNIQGAVKSFRDYSCCTQMERCTVMCMWQRQ